MAFLVGTERNGWQGILSKVLPEAKSKISVESAHKFTISLGFEYQELRKGSFNDKHEDTTNQEDRQQRFLPEYDKMWKEGPHQVLLPNGSLADADVLADVALRSTKYQVTGSDGKARVVDFGGVVPPQGTVRLLASHNE